jgi:hypothetical protein
VCDGPEGTVELPDKDAIELPPGRLGKKIAPSYAAAQVGGGGLIDELAGSLPSLSLSELPKR